MPQYLPFNPHPTAPARRLPPGARARVVEGAAMSIHDAQEVQQDQALSEGEGAMSHDAKSHDGANEE